MVLITYDVNTMTKEGRRRLRHVSKECVNFGQRVQYSVFECLVEPAQMVELKARLCGIIDPERDSIRIYYLGSNWRNRVEHIGAKASYDPEGPLVV